MSIETRKCYFICVTVYLLLFHMQITKIKWNKWISDGNLGIKCKSYFQVTEYQISRGLRTQKVIFQSQWVNVTTTTSLLRKKNNNCCLSTTGKNCSVAFIWILNTLGFHPHTQIRTTLQSIKKQHHRKMIRINELLITSSDTLQQNYSIRDLRKLFN